MPVRVQTEPFDVAVEIDRMRAGRPDVGAIASFIGTVRDVNDVLGQTSEVATLTLEHYPGMTERVLEEICVEACRRFEVADTLVVHRVGALRPLDMIVLVVVTSRHRDKAFAACQFIMDDLKTRAPFWKKEMTPEGSRWVETRESDLLAAERWRS